jgi:BirA family transcriptional regulator, biotin operon repressor / biotin---[acetyl-CoA-carboxylase] ligase
VEINNIIKKFLKKKNFTLVHLDSVNSTMIEIKKYLDVKKNICMIADKQTEGIGRRGNKWISPKGNIYISFLLKYNLLIEQHFLLSAATANSIANLLKKYVKAKINIKWPNDILVDNNKIAGIMTEIVETNDIKYILIGAGINISSAPKIYEYPTCCLNDHVVEIKHEEIIFEFIRSYFDEYEMVIQKKHNQVLEKFKKNMMYLDSYVNLLFPDGNLQNIYLKDLNYDGSLLIENKGIEQKIFSARIIGDIN